MSNSKKLEEVLEKVNCPKSAMTLEDGELFCNCPITLFRKDDIKKVSLGSIPIDVIRNCTDCKIKLQKDGEDTKKIIEIDKYHEVKCPAQMDKPASALECSKCPFFDSSYLIELEKKHGEDFEMKHIRCTYPKMHTDNLKVFLDAKQKKSLKDDKARNAANQEAKALF